jgi:EpsD family peptidyl-prolyl cis-trans isomerase
MRRLMISTSIVACALALGACGKKDSTAESLEKGQVVATVDGKDVTIHQLNAELAGMALPAGEKRKQIEVGALQALVSRTILADVARERGIDKSPTYILQQQRANESLLVQMLQRDIASKIPQPTRDEATKFMNDNPNLFAQRKIYSLDQIEFQMPDDVNKLKGYEPLKTMEEVEARTIEDGLEHRRHTAELDSVGANPELITQIAKLPPGEIFIVPGNGAIVASKITNTRTEPFTGDRANQYAMMMIQQKRLGEVTEKQLSERIKKARDAVKYQKGYAPPKPPTAPGAAPAAGAPAAAH